MKTVIVLATAAVAGFAAAIDADFSKFSDLDFAERYAFSTNRPALIAELKRDTGPWYFYSLLNYQVEGLVDEENEFLRKNGRADRLREEAWKRLQLRHMFLNWEASQGKAREGGRTPDEFLAWDLRSFLHINAPDYVREAAAAPNTYPSRIDPGEISFSAYLRAGFAAANCFTGDFRFLPLTGTFETPTHNDYFSTWVEYLPGTPGLFKTIREYIRTRNGKAFNNDKVFHALTLAEMDALAKEFGGPDWRAPLLENADFIKAYLRRLAPGADDDPAEYACRRAWLDRILAFARRLPASQAAHKAKALRDILALERDRGNFSERALLLEFAGMILSGGRPGPLAGRSDDALVADYLAALRRAGDDLAEFKGLVKAETLARICAETDLLSGASAEEVESSALSEQEFKALRDRVELKWSAANPASFASADPVSLGIDVKNVQKMRLAVYEVDAYRAAVRLGRELSADVDLDGCVPSVERTFDYSSFAPIVRHLERIDLPELSAPGVYVVECSGSGVSSRAVVRKGALRVVERVAACGHVFVALDEAGAVVKPAKLRVGAATYSSDDSGEIVVPFAAKATAGLKKAIVGAGARAAVREFDHRAEEYSLNLRAFLPQESAVDGERAKALLRARLSVSGAGASVSLLEKPALVVRLFGRDSDVVVRRIEDFKVSDTAEAEFSFAVPPRLDRVEFTLTATVQSACGGSPVVVSASDTLLFNGVANTTQIEQVFLRRGSDGYSLEVVGRNGEPLAGREVGVTLRHLAFTKPKVFTLQSDASGRIHLGRLADIETLQVTAPVDRTWNLMREAALSVPSELSAPEGAAFEIALQGLADGAWPLADELAARASLYGVNSENAVTATFPGNLSYSNGVLRIAPLPAGNYKLRLRAEKRTIDIKIAKASAPSVNGVIPGLRRSLGDTGAPARLRLAEASLKGRTLRVRAENASGETRIHVVCSRFVPTDKGLFDILADGGDRRSAESSPWPRSTTEYISGRDLGDKLRYILDRRNLPHRPGNMLDRPSLLLTPWSVGETRTAELSVRKGHGWGGAAAKSRAPACAAEAADGGSIGGRDEQQACNETPFCGFLAAPAGMWLNLRPNAAGVVELPIPEGVCIQDVSVAAVDSTGVDFRRLLAPMAELARRDRRHRSAPSANGIATRVREGRVVRGASAPAEEGARTSACRSVEDLLGLMRLFAASDDFASFEFLARWHRLSAEERRKLYGEYASHELDLFLFFKDRAFFDAVVAPHLRNKRFKQFMDKWLLGEDLSAWTTPGALQDLDALERCLLAKRIPSVRRLVADMAAAECAARAEDVFLYDRRLALALGVAEPYGSPSGGGPIAMAAPKPVLQAAEDDQAPPPSDDLAALSAQLKMARNDAVRRERAARRPFRPLDKTKEWIETHHYRVRHADEMRTKVAMNGFWRDYAAAIADGTDAEFLSENVILIGDGLTECLAALAVLALPFDAAEAKSAIVFSERRVDLADSGVRAIGIVQRVIDGSATDDDDASAAKHVANEFVVGRPYTLVTVFSNPTDAEVRFKWLVQIPDGAVAIGGGKETDLMFEALPAYSMREDAVSFYFPTADAVCGRMEPAVATSNRTVIGVADAIRCKVIAKPSREDTSSWWWVSQNGSDDDVIAFLGKANLWSEGVDLDKIGWRMKNDAFARRVFAALDARGCFHEGLWLTALEGRWRISDFKDRVRQLFSRRSMKKRLAAHLGPSFHCSLVDIEPEDVDLFEYAEFWPLVNARAHAARGGKAVIPNESLKAHYRRFLDTLATKKSPSAKDRIDAAVYLVAQERVDEAERMVASVGADDVDTKMQLDYLRAYFAFCRLKPEDGRAIALKYVDWPVPRWRDRFRAVVAQADEIAGRAPAASPQARNAEVAAAPSLELAAEAAGGVTEEVVVRSRNVSSAVIRAYQSDVEVSFSKDPFGGKDAFSTAAFLRPAWTTEVALGGDGSATVRIPNDLRGANLLLEASDPEGIVTASLMVQSGLLDVQVSSEYGELRVRDLGGRAIPAAYVKVYARDASGSTVKFHKDGYTDLRGAFNYAHVSTDSGFRPSEFAVLVLPDSGGVRTLTVKAP